MATIIAKPDFWRCLSGLVQIAEGLVYFLTLATIRPAWAFGYAIWLSNREFRQIEKEDHDQYGHYQDPQ